MPKVGYKIYTVSFNVLMSLHPIFYWGCIA